MTFREKLNITINKKYISESLKKHKGDYFCNKWWCHKIEIVDLPLNEIKPYVKRSFINEPKYKQMELEILQQGFNYEKSYIYLSSDNFIIDGHHRFQILKCNYEDSFLISVYRLTEMKSILIFVIKMSFIHLFIKIYRFLFKKDSDKIIELDL